MTGDDGDDGDNTSVFDENGVELPLIAIEGQGGPYEADSFLAGFTCGNLAALLAVGVSPEALAPEDLLPQLDLFAMHNGHTLTSTAMDDAEGWVLVSFAPAPPDPITAVRERQWGAILPCGCRVAWLEGDTHPRDVVETVDWQAVFPALPDGVSVTRWVLADDWPPMVLQHPVIPGVLRPLDSGGFVTGADHVDFRPESCLRVHPESPTVIEEWRPE